MAQTSLHSSTADDEEEQEQEAGDETSDLEDQVEEEEEEDEAEFNDAESIQLGIYDEQTVLTIRRAGGVISEV